MQTQEDHSNQIPALNVDSLKVDLIVIQNTCSEKEDSNSETASSKSGGTDPRLLTTFREVSIALIPRYEVGESLFVLCYCKPAERLRADYGFVATMDREIKQARLSREAWRRSMDASDLTLRRYSAVTSENAEGKPKEGPAKIKSDHTTWTGDSTTGTGYRTIGTTGTRWRVHAHPSARVAENGNQNEPKDNADHNNPQPHQQSTPPHRSNFQLQAMMTKASKPKTMQEAVEMATELIDKKVSTIAERQTENKRKFENTSRNNQNQQQQNKRQNIGRAYTAGTGEKKPYEGSKTLCRGTRLGQKSTCFECGVQGHFKRECPKLKNNKNRGNQVGNDRAPAKVYAVGHAGTKPDSNVVMGTFLLNNRILHNI
ncbi:reverse transcriptase domain-containing protein [Tanacetum coccineum]|uniref:Reverse transcriptase domain-containing protein n=1 Tax=Tanacetum coccineum TaxID=301880 RepID=A0ABQ5BRT8_9ASTR